MPAPMTMTRASWHSALSWTVSVLSDVLFRSTLECTLSLKALKSAITVSYDPTPTFKHLSVQYSDYFARNLGDLARP